MNTRSLAGLVVALVTSLLLYGVAKGEARLPTQPAPAAPTPVKVLTAYTAAEVPEFPGRVEAGESALLAFRVAGQIQALSIRMGDTVKSGQVLAELDPTDYRLRLEVRQAEFDLAQLGAQRASTLYTKKLISEDQFDTAQTLLATSRAKLEQAKEQLSFCQLKAPFGGNIAFTYAMPSEIVGPQQAVINLQDTSSLEIHFNLPSSYQSLLNATDRATFLVSSELLPGVQLRARYKEAGMRPDPDTNSYPVTLTTAPSEGLSLWPGMPARVQLHHATLFAGKWVPPAEALFERSGDSAHVWRIDEDTMTIGRVAVQLDASGVMLGGLEPGDRIVAAGVDRLTEGQKVQAWVREGGL